MRPIHKRQLQFIPPPLSDPRKPLIYIFILAFIHAVAISAFAGDNAFMATDVIGAGRFRLAHPECDGRGAVIFILDTGIDPATPGLLKTSTGEIKIIELRDFTHQGDVELYVGEMRSDSNESYIVHPDGFKLSGFERLAPKPMNNEYLVGHLNEERFLNSSVTDINRNGLIDDQFGILVFEVTDGAVSKYVAYVDTDADGHIDDEKPIEDYRSHFETFRLRGRDLQQRQNPLNFALSIFAEEMLVSVHFDDSGHGTHVAGIAAGYQINQQPGFDGVAPGAQIVSLKIGNNTYAGDATVSGSVHKALEYGIDYLRAHKLKGFFNISYGLGSETEGRGEIEQIIDRLIEENEDICICLSNGNMGPGISSTGCPASSNRAISTGAMLPRRLARDLYGAQLTDDKIFAFSARGGEVFKPDVIAPGVAVSSTPPFKNQDRLQGTSMASPHTAGSIALLLSALNQEMPDAPIKGALIKRALKASADPLIGYSTLDQGEGLIDVPKAWEVLKCYYARKETEQVLDYRITTTCPSYPDGIGSAAYWRNGGYFPAPNEGQRFTIEASFPQALDADRRGAFFRTYELTSAADWLKADRKFTYIKGENQTALNVLYDSTKLKSPGIYSDKIIAYTKGARKSPESIEFELQSTIIIPYEFTGANDYRIQFAEQQLAPGDLRRVFILIPPGASTMQVKIRPADLKKCAVETYLFDPDGHKYAVLDKASDEEENTIIKTITQESLESGIWEIVAYVSFVEKAASHFQLSISFTGLQIDAPILQAFQYDTGEKPHGEFSATNEYTLPFSGTANGTIAGYKRISRIPLRAGRNAYRTYFKTESNIEKSVFEIEFAPADFQQFTDVAINIENRDGEYLVKEGMNFRRKRVVFENPGAGQYTLEIAPAFANKDFSDRWEFMLTEYQYLLKSEYIEIEVKSEGKSHFDLYPNMKSRLTFTLSETPRVAPNGFTNFGMIFFKDEHTQEIKSTLAVSLKTSIE